MFLLVELIIPQHQKINNKMSRTKPALTGKITAAAHAHAWPDELRLFSDIL